jgi:hypothetical protein
MRINNSELSQELINGSGITGLNSIPNDLGKTIVPVMEVNPRLLRKINIVKAQSRATTSASPITLYTTPARKDFYLVGVTYTITKDAACDAATTIYGFKCYVGSLQVQLYGKYHITLTAEQESIYLVFPIPIKCDRATAISLDAISYTAGICCRNLCIMGFVDEGTI